MGSPRICSEEATSSSSSASILSTLSLSPNFSATLSSSGAISWHGPHHTAKMSTRMGVSQSCVCVGGVKTGDGVGRCVQRAMYMSYTKLLYKTQHLWRVGRHELQSAAVWDSSEPRDRHFGDRHFGDRNFGDRNFGDRNLRELAYLDRFLELGCVHLAHGTAVDGGVSVEGANPSERKPNGREPSDLCRGSEQEQEA